MRFAATVEGYVSFKATLVSYTNTVAKNAMQSTALQRTRIKMTKVDSEMQIALRIGALMRIDGFEPPSLDSKRNFALMKIERYIIWLRENQSKYMN